MEPASAAVSIALMAMSAGAALFMRHERLGAAAGFATVLGMADGVWADRVLAPVVWFAAITALVIAAACSYRLRASRDAANARPPGDPSATVFGGCSSILMGVLILQASTGGDGLAGMAHAMSAGVSSSALLAIAIAQGLVCVGVAARAAIRRRSIALAVEMGGMGASVIVMAVGMV